MKKNKKEEPKEELPSYLWVSIMRTEQGFVVLQCESEGERFDPQTLKASTPEVLQLALAQARKILQDKFK